MPLVVDVLFPLPVPPFRYLVPPGAAAGPVAGRVAAPWQGSVRIGLAVGSEEVPAQALGEYREVVCWLDSEPFVGEGALALIDELAATTGAPAGIVLATLLTTGLRDELVHEVRAIEGAPGLLLSSQEWIDAARLGASELELYRRQGLLEERARPVRKTTRRLVAARPPDDGLAGAAQVNQRLALERLNSLESVESAAGLARAAGVPDSAVRALVRKGYAEYRDLPAPPPSLPVPVPSEPALQPRGEGLPDAAVTLVTGGLRSDRLATMLETLRSDVAAGNSVLVLVPEAALLASTAAQLAALLPVVELSGASSDEQRARVWDEVAVGTPLVVVGTYGALLAPFPRLARIVVLEAGSASYKLLAGARLFVPSSARALARNRGVPLVLSDVLASPEMELWAGEQGSEISLPLVRQRLHVSDLGSVAGWPVGSELTRVLKQVQERERQALILAPRRGFSAAMSCADCGHSLMCPNCDLTLRYHRSRSLLRCHQCGYATEPPQECPRCRSLSLGPGRAAGTEWAADVIAKLLPGMRVARFDSDQQDDLAPLVGGEPGVLVTTTAALRLPPLPNLALVGVTLLDTHLNVSDFRAAEEVLRLLLNLPELAPGRRVLEVVQTFQPDHVVVEAMTSDDLDAAVAEVRGSIRERRRAFGYPPFGNLAKIQLSSRDDASARQAAERVTGHLLTAGAREEEIMGPVAAPVGRVRGNYSHLVYLRSDGPQRFAELLALLPRPPSGVKLRVDADPRDVAEFID